MTTAWEMHDDPEITRTIPGALTKQGQRLMGCATDERITLHTARLGSVYWTCTACGVIRETSACTPEDFPSSAPPAVHFPANLAAPGAEDSSAPDVRPGTQCVQCRRDEAVMTAYFDDLGQTANLLPWCAGCCATLAPLTVAIGLPVTLLPLEPIPGLAELRAQLDRAQLGDRPAVDPHQEAAELVRRTRPLGRKPGQWR